MDSQAAARRWAATWTVAWRAHDVEAVVALYAEDCVHRSTPFREPQAVRDYVTQALLLG
jgi:ketosteroid isomerase-like protein